MFSRFVNVDSQSFPDTETCVHKICQWNRKRTNFSILINIEIWKLVRTKLRRKEIILDVLKKILFLLVEKLIPLRGMYAGLVSFSLGPHGRPDARRAVRASDLFYMYILAF